MNDEELRARVRESMFRQCHMRGYAAPVDVLMDIGALSKKNYEDWRFGRADTLERVCSMNLSKLSAVLREMYACAKAQNDAGRCRRRSGGAQWTGSAFVSIPRSITSFLINSPHGYIVYHAVFLCLFLGGTVNADGTAGL